MIDPEYFDSLVAEVAELNGLDLDTAGDVVVAVGDTPMIDSDTGLIFAEWEDGRNFLVSWPGENG